MCSSDLMAVNGYELWEQSSRGQSKAQKQFISVLDGKLPLTAKALLAVTA